MRPEKRIQTKLVNWAKDTYEDVEIIKLSTLGRYGSNGWPDLQILTHKRVMFLEMKAEGNTATELQEQRLERLRELGFFAEVCDDLEQGKKWITEFMEAGPCH